MKQIAQLLKADLGVEPLLPSERLGHAQNQGSVNGQLANRLARFLRSIAAFWRDLGDDAENVRWSRCRSSADGTRKRHRRHRTRPCAMPCSFWAGT